MTQNHHCDAQCSTIEIAWVVLVIAAAILGGCALFSAPVWRWLFLAAGLFSALGAMAVGINVEWLAALDVSVETWVGAHRSRWLEEAVGIFRFIGQPVRGASVAVVCGALLSLHARSAIPGFLVVSGVGFGVVAERTVKAIVGRTSTAVAELQSRRDLLYFEHSFPSGPVTVGAVLLGMIAVCLGVGRSRPVKVALAVPAVAGVLFVAFVSVYSEPHVFTDVIGGLILGGAIVSLGAAVLGATHYTRRDSAAAPVAPVDLTAGSAGAKRAGMRGIVGMLWWRRRWPGLVL